MNDTTKQLLGSSGYIGDISHEYSTYVLRHRAIPLITDGLKESQRIALWLMRNRSGSIKTMKLIGEMSGELLYVHGNAAAEAMVGRLAAPFLNNIPLLDGEGAFGSRIAPDAIGAARYTEVARSDFARDELYTDLDLCPMKENYDGSRLMPVTFLPRIPIILLNGVAGIAVGFANKILPRDLGELREAVLEVLSKGKTTLPLMPHFTRYNCKVARDSSNPNKYHLTGSVEIKNTTTAQITELPPGMNLDTVKERLITLEENKKIVSFVDNSADHIDITVKMTRAELSNYDEDSLAALFKLTISETENLTVLDSTGTRVIRYDSVQDMIKDFVEWRLGLYLDRYQRLLGIEEDTALFWRCFLSCFESPGARKRSVAASISGIQSRAALATAVEESIQAQGLEVRKEIVDKIVGFPVYRFTKEGQADAREKLTNAEKLIAEYTEIIQSPAKRKRIYRKEVKE